MQLDLTARLEPLSRRTDLEDLWRDLERRSDGSFFQSWAWIGSWLRNLPSDLALRVLTVSAGHETVGLGVLVARRERRHGWLNTGMLRLNETGDDRIDSIAIEYNGFLADRNIGISRVVRCCLNWLVENEDSWDELSLSGLDAATTAVVVKIATELSLGVRTHAEERCPYVDLSYLRRSGGDYLGSLSRNTRYQIRRAIRLYEGFGPLSISTAASTIEALDFLESLGELHQASWIRRGHSGAFADDFFRRFHRELVSIHFDAGEIQLLRVSAGSQIVGYLYNLVKNRRVCAYQSGFNFDADSRLKPGLVAHSLAVEYNLRMGANIYDFMAGEGQHKRSLASNVEAMIWLVVYRKHLKLRFENLLRELKAGAKRKMAMMEGGEQINSVGQSRRLRTEQAF